jgi:aspartate/methionine/tyrosine aminotransferase
MVPPCLLAPTLFAAAAARSTDPCQPHGETNVLTGKCWGGGDRPGCFACFYGHNCAQFNESAACLVDASRNYFLLWQSYFEAPSFPESTVPSSWAMPYQSFDSRGVVPPLEDSIRALHKQAGNADPDGKQLLLCNGARGCTLALFYAMNMVYGPAAGGPLQIFSRAPYFTLNPLLVPLAATGAATDAVWNASANPNDQMSVELLTSPNNPDGALQRPLVRNKSHVICDGVYNWGWNHAPVEDLGCKNTVFSISKLTGHCGSRVGWALVEDPLIFHHAFRHVLLTAGGVSVEAQARTHTLLQTLVERNSSFFAEARLVLEARWDQLEAPDVLPACTASGLIVQDNRKNRGPLLWLAVPAGQDALATLAVAGIQGEAGPGFGGTTQNARVNLAIEGASWDKMLLPRLRRLCTTPPSDVWALADKVVLGTPRPFVA